MMGPVIGFVSSKMRLGELQVTPAAGVPEQVASSNWISLLPALVKVTSIAPLPPGFAWISGKLVFVSAPETPVPVCTPTLGSETDSETEVLYGDDPWRVPWTWNPLPVL